jgi:Fe-S-cluster containining protein
MDESKELHLERIYRMIPRMVCKGLCGWDPDREDGCCGPLAMTKLERLRIVQAVGRAPKADPTTHKCNMLDEENRCRCYQVRPAICRLWGAVRAMPCPHGCKPERYLSVVESVEIIRLVKEVGGPTVSDPYTRERSLQDDSAGQIVVSLMEYYRKRDL